HPSWWVADAVTETLVRTNLGDLHAGDPVNLERPMRLGDRLGGHLVQGHVDGTGTVAAKQPNPDGSLTLKVVARPEITRYAVEKGSTTADGVTLTRVDAAPSHFTIALIPHTQRETTLGPKPVGARVNLEIDVIAKYVERLLSKERA